MKDEQFTADEIPCLTTAPPDVIVRFLASRAFTRNEVSRMLGIDIWRFAGLVDAYEVGRALSSENLSKLDIALDEV